MENKSEGSKELLKKYFSVPRNRETVVANHVFYHISNGVFNLYGKRFSPSTLERKFRLLIETGEIEVKKELAQKEGSRYYLYTVTKIN